MSNFKLKLFDMDITWKYLLILNVWYRKTSLYTISLSTSKSIAEIGLSWICLGNFGRNSLENYTKPLWGWTWGQWWNPLLGKF